MTCTYSPAHGFPHWHEHRTALHGSAQEIGTGCAASLRIALPGQSGRILAEAPGNRALEVVVAGNGDRQGEKPGSEPCDLLEPRGRGRGHCARKWRVATRTGPSRQCACRPACRPWSRPSAAYRRPVEQRQGQLREAAFGLSGEGSAIGRRPPFEGKGKDGEQTPDRRTI
jgi:hypothetical protein